MISLRSNFKKFYFGFLDLEKELHEGRIAPLLLPLLLHELVYTPSMSTIDSLLSEEDNKLQDCTTTEEVEETCGSKLDIIPSKRNQGVFYWACGKEQGPLSKEACEELAAIIAKKNKAAYASFKSSLLFWQSNKPDENGKCPLVGYINHGLNRLFGL